MFEFTAIDTLDINGFPDLCDGLDGPFGSRYFDSYVCEINLLCACEGFRNETQNYRQITNTRDVRVKIQIWTLW